MNQNEIASSKHPQSKNRRRLFKVLGCFIPLLACAAITAFYANRAAYGVKTELVSLDFGDGYTISVWSETDGILDPSWDLDHSPAVYYEVTRSGNIIKPKRYLTASWEPFSVSTAFADAGELIGINIYVVECLTRHSVLIVLKHLENDTWFIGGPSDTARQSWISGYDRLKQENPAWPPCL